MTKERTGTRKAAAKRICPYCGSRDTAPILYGMPAFDEKMEARLEAHELYLGGCLVSEDNPDYHCFNCERDFAKGQARLELDNKTFTRKLLDKAVFFAFASGGAMGEPGGIEFVTDEGQVGHANYAYGDLKWATLEKAFPAIRECCFGLLGTGSEVPDGWVYVHLGMGNHLMVRQEWYAAFAERTKIYTELGELYQHWKEEALRCVREAGKNPTADSTKWEPMMYSDKTDELGKNRIRLHLGDITQLQVDAIVNAANSSLLGGGGVDGAIHRAAGPELLAECRTLHGCRTGEAKITGGYRLPARFVIHTVGPIYDEGDPRCPQLLEDCYRNSLDLAAERGLHSVAFPAISTGVYGYPWEGAARVAYGTVTAWLKAHPDYGMEVTFVFMSETMLRIYREREEASK